MKIRVLFVACLLACTFLLSACAPHEQPPERPKLGGRPTHIGIITKVSEGDTLSAAINGIPETIRLTGIDCPEHDQPFAKEATQLAKKLALEKAVRVTELGRDKYHRLLGEVVLPNGRMLNRELVREGVCWWYQKFAPRDTVLEGLEKYAREERKGLWINPQPVPPWEWRKRK